MTTENIAPKETLLCIKSRLINSFYSFTVGDSLQLLQTILEKRNQFWIPRAEAETDPTYKQIIPYTLIVDGLTDRVLTYVRSKLSGETRLHSKASMGIGGHITWEEDMPDVAVGSADFGYNELLKAQDRELREELSITPKKPEGTTNDNYSAIAGFVNDDTDEVGRVHLGIVFVHRVFNCNVEPHKKTGREISDIRLYEPRSISAMTPEAEFEKWSQHCAFDIHRILGSTEIR
jgi:predicted NUDIX family phosphoesterase